MQAQLCEIVAIDLVDCGLKSSCGGGREEVRVASVGISGLQIPVAK